MNLRYVLKQLGLLLLVLSAVLVGVAAVFFLAEAGLKHDVTRTAMQAMFITGLIGILAGGGAWLFTRKTEQQIGRRAALLLVAVSWLGGAAFAGLPFFLWAHLPGTDAPDGHPFRSFVNCYFEAMSGLTTTGATILAGDPATGWEIESVPRSLLLWRAFTQWLGGLGIVVLFVAVLPSLGVGGKRLFQVEAPGPAPEGLQPQIRQTARVLLQREHRRLRQRRRRHHRHLLHGPGGRELQPLLRADPPPVRQGPAGPRTADIPGAAGRGVAGHRAQPARDEHRHDHGRDDIRVRGPGGPPRDLHDGLHRHHHRLLHR
jgi:hypothetical protein